MATLNQIPSEKTQWIHDNLVSWADCIDKSSPPNIRAESFLNIVKKHLAINAGNTSIKPDFHGMRELEEKLGRFMEVKRLTRVIYILEYYLANNTFDMPHPDDTPIVFYRQRFWELKNLVQRIILQEE